MILRDVEGVEVVPLVLDFRAARHLEAQAREVLDDLFQEERDGVETPHAVGTLRGGRHIHPAGRERRFLGARFEDERPRLDALLRLGLQRVDLCSRAGTLVRGHPPELLQEAGDLALLTEQAHPHVFEGHERFGGLDEALDLHAVHVLSPSSRARGR